MKKAVIRERILMAIFVFLIIAVFVMAGLSRAYLADYADILQSNLSDRLIQTARSAATQVSVSELDRLMKERDVSSSLYRQTKIKLIDFAKQNDVLFVYYMKFDGNRLMYVIDNDMDPNTAVNLGQVTDADDYVMNAFSGVSVSTHMGRYQGSWDGLMSAYAPVTIGNEVRYVVGVDISDATLVNVLEQNNRVGTTFIVILSVTSIVGLVFIFQMRKRTEVYKAASMAKSDFLSRMSHEIRTPMNAIIGLSKMGAESDDTDEIHEYVDKIRASSTYLLSLLNSILDISKIEAGKMKLDETSVDIEVLMCRIEGMIAAQAAANDIELTFELQEGITKDVMADDTLLTQILMNLLGNAIKFTPEGGRVTLAVKELPCTDDRVHLSFVVSDTGVGIAEENHSKLFELFEQEDGSTTRKYGGTGLGLAISKMLVELMGGNISVESAIGEGSVFSFDIYVHAAQSQTSAGILDAEDSNLDCSGKLFLVVEDNEINRMVAGNVLEGFGASVDFAEDGKEGIEMFTASAGRYDAIFMDIQMPVMDGYEATRKIRNSDMPDAKDIPIIAMSANVFAEDIEKALDSGMNDHVGKPLDLSAVVAAISRNM